MNLCELLQATDGVVLQGDARTEIRDLCYDSRAVTPGALFVCLPGLHTDGHNYALQAAAAGAAGIVCERLPDGLPQDLPVVQVTHSRRALAQLAIQLYGAPARQMTMIGITGTKGKTTTAHKLAASLRGAGVESAVVSLDNFFKNVQDYPRLPDGTLDYENPDTLDMPLIRQCLSDLSTTGKTVLPIYDFTTESRSSETETLDLKGGVCIVEGIHALNPELTGLVKGDDIYRIYAGLREEYCIDGRRVINTQDIRLCRRTLRDAAARGRSPAKTLAMWDRVLDGETRYIKGFKTTADFLLDTSFTYELGLIAKLLRPVSQRFTLEGHNAELWDETARRFEHVAPVELELLPADSMLREFYAGEV